ncbi:carbohydrate kinase family protein [Candidatus Roizmanbacteria bacterium]|nr:carbohydrate kinase family protein [Candidatus Roizmanbacteria bacterium]
MNFPGSFGDHILPDQIHKINLSFIVDKFARRRGGTAGNVSYSLGLLKTPHILFSVAGRDFADYKKEFEKFNILTDDVWIDKNNYTSVGFAMTDKRDNQIWGYFYGASEKIKNLNLKEVASNRNLLLIGPSGAEGSMSFVRQAIKLRIPYMFDPGFILTQVSDKDLELGVSNADFLIGNDYEINIIKKRIKSWEKITSEKTIIIITTLGEKGAAIKTSGEEYRVLAVKPKKILDPTGAGDAWRAGFLSGLDRKFDLKTCGQMGAVVASFAIEKYGSQEHKFTVSEFEDRYRQNFGGLLEL